MTSLDGTILVTGCAGGRFLMNQVRLLIEL